jgi:CRISPR-associated protein (TIGR02710 family)
LGQYNYPAAIAELKKPLQMELPQDLKRQVKMLHECCVGFDAWDRFDHAEAWRSLKPYLANPALNPTLLFLKRVMTSREAFSEASGDNFKAPESMKSHGYEMVEDLLLNAERRATLERYDDAVARLYRALELLCQVHLWRKYTIKTGDVEVDQLPEALRSRYDEGNSKIRVGLRQGYELLGYFLNDPLGKLYEQHEKRIMSCLEVRNQSILAHGLKPVAQCDYLQFKAAIAGFLHDGIRAVTGSSAQAHQFPQTIE